MKLRFILLIFVMLFTLTGCFNKPAVPPKDTVKKGNDPSENIEWYVIKREPQRVLVVNPIPEDLGSSGNREFYDAVWVSNFPDDAQVGQKVKILFKGEIATSYPGLSGAKEVTVLPSIKPDKAKLSEEQVLREAINIKEATEIKIFVPTAIKFDDKSHLWTVRFKDGALTDTQKEEKSLQIPDK